MMLFLTAVLTTALAADVPPREASVPVRVFGNGQESVYHKLAPGGQLTFQTPGPGKWSVDLRQRITAQDGQTRGTVLVLGNGKHRIMSIPLKNAAETGIRIDDPRGGTISKHERAIITVPAAGKFLTLKLAPGSSETLVRLFDDKPEPPPAVAAAAPPPPVATPPKAQASPPKAAAPAKPKTSAKKKTPREPRWNLGVGLSTGLGIPARGSKAVGYFGTDVRYPVYKKLVSVGGSVGWYRIAVDESFTVADPYLGHATVDAQWHTSVVPIIARGLAHSPVTVGPVRPLAGLGLGLFIASRSEGDYSTTQVGFGPELLAGADYDLGHLGTFGANLTWAEARMYLGHQDADGMPIRETVAHTRLNLSWFHTF